MPELPEVECTRRSLAPHILGRRVARLTRGPHEVVVGPSEDADLLLNSILLEVHRHGKELLLLSGPTVPDAAPGQRQTTHAPPAPCVVVHLGMTGSLQHHSAAAAPVANDPHVHLQWHLNDGSRLVFRDPRRFGGLWTYPSLAALHAQRWQHRGPDALSATPAALHDRLRRTRRAIKAALLDQTVVAGLGNITSTSCSLAPASHPLTPACTVDRPTAASLARRMRTLLERAIAAGGSTLRDYADGLGRAGGYQHAHRVYGRAGLPCRRCQAPLTGLVVGGRSTVCCERAASRWRALRERQASP